MHGAVMAVYFLEGKRIGLRPLRKSDVEANYGNWLNDRSVCEYNAHHRWPYSVKMLEDYVAMTDSNSAILALAIEDKEAQIHLGNISLQAIDYVSQCAEFAILIGEKSYWHQGVGKEAGNLLVAHGFQELNLRRIYLGTSIHNVGMQKLAISLGFKQEGVRRQALYKHGAFVDIVEFGLLKTEWLDSHSVSYPEYAID